MVLIKPTVKALFLAKKSAFNIEDHLDSIGLSLQPHEDMDKLTRFPLEMFNALFEVNGECRGRVEMDFIDLPDFDTFWKCYGASITWRDCDG